MWFGSAAVAVAIMAVAVLAVAAEFLFNDIEERYAREPRVAGLPAERLALDLSIARGLDYYTGTIYETFLSDLPGIGSVCSGGRYDHLAELFTSQPLPGVGASLGLDRLLAAMEELGLTDGTATPTQVVPGEDVQIVFMSCLGQETAFWRSDRKEIVFCYELLERFERLYRARACLADEGLTEEALETCLAR